MTAAGTGAPAIEVHGLRTTYGDLAAVDDVSFVVHDGACSQVLPLRHLDDGMLDVMVRGEGPRAAVFPLRFLLVLALVVTLVAVRLFRWEE